MKEASITVNGQLLTVGQSMTVRVALEGFSRDLRENGLGDDELGVEMTKRYLERAAEVGRLLREEAP